MKVVVESHIPYIQGLMERYAQVQYLAPEHIDNQSVADADALVVRTRTKCNAQLLDGSRCSIVATATIGTDHIDLPYCLGRGIEVHNAPGCNAPAVAQYVHSAIGYWLSQRPEAKRITLGVVGVGHVGSIVSRWGRELGYRVLECDPPRAEREGASHFATLGQIAREADIITFHTPLTKDGPHPTFHLADDAFFASLGKCRLLINSARGGIVDEAALLASGVDFVIDCWESEPNISEETLRRAFVATPHIAGYSLEGKKRGTAMAVDALCRHFGWDIKPEWPAAPQNGASNVTIGKIMDSYNPLAETALLKNHGGDIASTFESLRNHYAYRAEVFD